MKKRPISGPIEPQNICGFRCSPTKSSGACRRNGNQQLNRSFTKATRACLVTAILLLAVSPNWSWSVESSPAAQRKRVEQEMKDGNFKAAHALFRNLVLEPTGQNGQIGQDLQQAINCLGKLGRIAELDSLVENAIQLHATDWRLLGSAAEIYLQAPHHGYVIAGEFRRGDHRGGGQLANSLQRDRVRALQLFHQALTGVPPNEEKQRVASFYWKLVNALLYGRGHREAWRLQNLTDLSELPDYEDGYPRGGTPQGAPVDAEGNPLFHRAVEHWGDATTDGQRWRWALNEIIQQESQQRDKVMTYQANFYRQQLGVQTMRFGGSIFRLGETDDAEGDESGTYALHTLGENETIARLATGIRRFELPDEFNFIRIYQGITGNPRSSQVDQALTALAEIFENRRQYPQAAEYWQRSIQHRQTPHKEKRLQQIIGNWGQFGSVMTQPAGEGATVEYTFRNGTQVELTAHEIRFENLLRDVKTYLRANPSRIDRNKISLDSLGYRLVSRGEEKYVGREAARWTLDLEPRANHFDRRITVQTPLQKAGAYLLTATLSDGNTSKIILWVADTAIAKKQLSRQTLYFVADAVTGRPVAGANVEFFGYRQEHIRGNRYRVRTANFAERTDENGQVVPHVKDLLKGHQWVAIARTEDGRLAYLGFNRIWSGEYHDSEYNATKALLITDRPVYRPDQTVHFKAWVRYAKYDMEDGSMFAGKSFPLEITDPQGNSVFKQQFTADEYGGFEGELQLATDAMLGQYYIHLPNTVAEQGGGTFRVEEYKKPEFEVTVDAPTEPVMLGETISAKISARYYFGSPVTQAKVKYKVTRATHDQPWFPRATWDWCYGSGYWWFGYDYPWYPGWNHWAGCLRPSPWWWPHQPAPPEVVAEREVEIGPDGTVEVEFDTSTAQQNHPNHDHRYTITAEIVDASRRTIVGSGQVLVARKPFKVFTWLGRGYYRAGDVIDANFLAQTLNDTPVQGSGRLTLYRITYNEEQQPVESAVEQWKLDTDTQGKSRQQIRAAQKGQYRISYQVTDDAEHTIEGGYVFTVVGDDFDGREYRFNEIELIPERREYAPGEVVRLQINTNRVGSTVLLFVRPANGVYLPPKVLRMEGKSVVEEIGVVQSDMPNFFVEALTISEGRIYSETKEIVVPPEKRVVNVEILPSAEEFLPGENATVKLQLTDADGAAVVGSTAVSIYDKSVEYISGGSNVPDLREFFWKWRRRHQERTESTLHRRTRNFYLPKKLAMRNIGIFGGSVADDLDSRWGRRRLSGRGEVGGSIRGRAMVADFAGLAQPESMAVADSSMLGGDLNGPAASEIPPPMIEPSVRSEFADTALWTGTLETDASGMAELSLAMPENLTTWKIRVWSMSHGTRVGAADAEVVTRKNLIVRLQAPRFFVEKDEVFLSANVHNYLAGEKSVQVTLDLPGEELEPLDDLTRVVTVPANGEQRVDWRVRVVREGEAVVRMSALTDEESDAVQMKFPSYVHGMLKTDSWAGTVRPDEDRQQLTIHVPAERRVEQSLLEVRFSPTLAGAMVDALPYLADYPHGCTEQTLNRFLPTVITHKLLVEMDLDLAAIAEKRTNLNAQEVGDDRQRARQWKRFDANPVFDDGEVARMVTEGVKRLTNMQNSDGGWGWFSGTEERSWPHTTAVVVHGLQVARQNGVALVPDVLERGIGWMENYQKEQVQRIINWGQKNKPKKQHADNLDALVAMILMDADRANQEMLDFLYRDRNALAVYSKAMLGLIFQRQQHEQRLGMMLKNIEQYLVQDEENETAYLKLPADSSWWVWYGSETDANAYYLKLLARVDPQGMTAPRLVKYLLNNRKHATYWRSTRDTANCIEAFADYLRATDELSPEMVVEVWMDGEHKKSVEITPANLFTFDNRFVLVGDKVTEGSHNVEIRRTGTGSVYFNAYLTNFSLEDYIPPAGLEVRVKREFYRLRPVEKQSKVAGGRGQSLDQRVEKYQRELLDDLATLTSGDLVEVEMEIESKNDYEYLIFEDFKPAGFEAVEVRSGYTNRGMRAYMELRDNRVSFFVRQLARGRHSVAYRLRAEIPGQFSALPARASAMYAPELRGNSDEIKLMIVDAE